VAPWAGVVTRPIVKIRVDDVGRGSLTVDGVELPACDFVLRGCVGELTALEVTILPQSVEFDGPVAVVGAADVIEQQAGEIRGLRDEANSLARDVIYMHRQLTELRAEATDGRA